MYQPYRNNILLLIHISTQFVILFEICHYQYNNNKIQSESICSESGCMVRVIANNRRNFNNKVKLCAKTIIHEIQYNPPSPNAVSRIRGLLCVCLGSQTATNVYAIYDRLRPSLNDVHYSLAFRSSITFSELCNMRSASPSRHR